MRHRTAIAISIASAVVAGSVVLLMPRSLVPDRHLPAPEKLAPAVRAALRQGMARHGHDMTEMVWAVMLLDYDGVGRAAERIAAETPLPRPTAPGANEVNAQLPERFYQLQDQLRAQAVRLAAAARTQGADELTDAYGELSRTCVGCHRIYLEGPSAARPVPREPGQAAD